MSTDERAATVEIDARIEPRRHLEELLSWSEIEYRRLRESGHASAGHFAVAIGDLARFSAALREIFGK